MPRGVTRAVVLISQRLWLLSTALEVEPLWTKENWGHAHTQLVTADLYRCIDFKDSIIHRRVHTNIDTCAYFIARLFSASTPTYNLLLWHRWSCTVNSDVGATVAFPHLTLLKAYLTRTSLINRKNNGVILYTVPHWWAHSARSKLHTSSFLLPSLQLAGVMVHLHTLC